ncbi:alpha-mannosidase [Pseudalkalibacillus salsuginis]|uniref:alpha-mannosidase n=1 Tax=Pseudalkalibacillus salsuginis TaxID=2910972 RepID=UPI001F272CC9|nr:alpha-mannosidase [Pseudalkalibacillus salsuginis]MCF6409489.1 alpha-mannosidase [Pseudalkalibacillus salsuginis]
MLRIQRLIRILQAHQYKDLLEIQGWTSKKAQYVNPGEYSYHNENLEGLLINIGDLVADSGTTAFLDKEVEIPRNWQNDTIGILFKVNGNGMQSYCESLISIQGIPTQGLDRNRDLVIIPPEKTGNKVLHIQVEVFNPVGIPKDHLRGFNLVACPETDPPPGYLEQSSLVLINKEVQSLLYTLEVCYKTATLLDRSDTRYHLLHKAMGQVVDQLGMPSKETLLDQSLLRKMEAGLSQTVNDLSGFREGTIRAIGQSHIDIAWLWPIKETIRKGSRTFSSVCTLLEEYNDFEFAQSQPQLFSFLKEYQPKVYERVKQKVADGRFEIIGGMWVEPDLNIPSGESLVRQLLYGKKFFKDEFGVEPRVEWLPDTFGYCASLPQILKKAGTDYFMTTKLNWNDTNRFPYDLFNWEGIDGTKILSYLHNILGQQTDPADIHRTWEDYNQKNEFPERMLVYGYGDGGGGVTREMIEYLERSSNLPGLPDVKFDKVHDFFDRIDSKKPQLPNWYGDLYLELHRGTYTTHAKTKKNNRKAESLYRELEIWNSLAHITLGTAYPMEEINKGWQLIMLNQFHDIVPGTSISPVYDLSEKQYNELFEIGTRLKEEAIKYITQSINTEGPGQPIILLNSLSWTRDEMITITGGKELLTKKIIDKQGNSYKTDFIVSDDESVTLNTYIDRIPEMGYKTVWLEDADQQEVALSKEFSSHWETLVYKVEFTDNGWISRLYDKEADKEIIKDGEYANELQIFDDLPTDWDAWDIDPNFEKQREINPHLMDSKVIYKGSVSDKLEFIWKVNHSLVTQEITFYHDSKKIDFKTTVDWLEKHKLLKVAFPVNIYSSKATYEIPFGSIERATHNNTSWEQAQYEVCGQRWADLSEGNYGVSLLNDCKYGYDIKGNKIRLSLLRAPKWPDTQADLMKHEFTYSLFPHEGDWRNGDTVKKGQELNSPITVAMTSAHSGELPDLMAFINTKSESVIVDSIKQAENKDGIILRMYESKGSETSAILQFGQTINAINETNLLEQPVTKLSMKDGQISRKFHPYEISTYHVMK